MRCCAAAPEVRILATSREALHIRGEQTYPVLPLAVPDRNAGRRRACCARKRCNCSWNVRDCKSPSFALTERDAPAVAELCARLDGIPLALELAAARMRSLSVDEINARLHDRFKLLTGGSRVALERQQTLRALVSWSYDLLQENEQMLLDRLSVFAGGFDLAAAEAVCGADPLEPDDVLDLVTLAGREVAGHGRAGRRRSRATDCSRRSASSRTSTCSKRYGHAGDDPGICQGALGRPRRRRRDRGAALRLFLRVCKDDPRTSCSAPSRRSGRVRAEAELDNLRAAIALALSRRRRSGDGGQVRSRVDALPDAARLLDRSPQERARRTRASWHAGAELVPRPRALRRWRARDQSERPCRGDENADRVPGDSPGSRRTRGRSPRRCPRLATLHLQQDDAAKAREYEEEAIAIFRSLEDRLGEAIGLINLGEIAVRQADDDGARSLFEQVPADRAKHQAPGAGKRMRAQSRRAGAGDGRPAGRAAALRAVAQDLPRCAGQARRGDNALAPRQGRRRERRPRGRVQRV